jgi:hypothetical protein
MNEWVAFGVVALICGLLAVLVWLSGGDEYPSPDTPTDDAEPCRSPSEDR